VSNQFPQAPRPAPVAAPAPANKDAAPKEADVPKLYPDEINTATCSAILGMGELHVKAMAREEKIPTAKKNAKGFWKFSKAAIVKYAEERKTMPRSRTPNGKVKYFGYFTEDEYKVFNEKFPGLLQRVNKPAKKAVAPAAPAETN
jgi:hypothetical protein